MESLVSSPGPASPKTNGADAFAIDSTVIVDHLTKVLEITFGATREELERPGSLLSRELKPSTIQRCTRFASENQVALYVTKDISTEETDGEVDDSSMSFPSRLLATS
jgi:dynein heavy chain 1